jgi:hypothetical protein
VPLSLGGSNRSICPSHGVASVKSAQVVIVALLGGTDPRLEPILDMRH